MKYDEPQGLKFARALMWGAALMRAQKNMAKGKHFLWLEPKAYDLGVLTTAGIPPKLVVAVSDDPDVALDAQQKYPEYKIICGNPIDLVKREGRVFTTMLFGFTRPFTKSYFDDILTMLTHGIKDGGQFFMGLSKGDEEGEELLQSGFTILYDRIRQTMAMDDVAIVADYLDRAPTEEKESIRSVMSTTKGMWELVKKARDYAKNSLEVLEEYEKLGRHGAVAALRAHNFLNTLREAIFSKKFACNPKEVIFVEGPPETYKEGNTYHSLLLSYGILRALPGENQKRFERRSFEAARENADSESMTVRFEKEDLFETFYKENKEKLGKDFPWEQYFSVSSEVVEEWRKTWLR